MQFAFIIILLTFFKISKCLTLFDIRFVETFLINYTSTTSTTFLNVCCSKKIFANLIENLSSNGINAAIVNHTEIYLLENSPINGNAYFVMDMSCYGSAQILPTINDYGLFRTPHKWLFLIAENNNNFWKNLAKLNIGTDSDVIVANSLNEDEHRLVEFYKTNSDYTTRKNITTSQLNDGFLNNRVLSRGRQNLNGTLMKSTVAITSNDTLNHLQDYRFPHIDTISKVSFILINHLIESVNGRKEFTFVNTWGYRNKNNSLYNGMIGTLQRHEAEIGGTALFLTKDRVSVIDYIPIHTPTRAQFVFRQPPLSYVTNVFTLPFTKSVWISLICLIIFTTILLYIAVMCEVRKMNLKKTDNMLLDSIVDIVMLTMAAVAQQGTNTEPRSTAGKIIMILTFIALMFLYVSYSANIVALLQSSATNINTLEDLLKSRIKLGVDDKVYNHYYFENAKEPVRKAIYEQKIASTDPPSFMQLNEGIQKMRSSFFAFHIEVGSGYKLVSDTFQEFEKCGLKGISYLQVVDPHFAIKKNSTYKELLKLGLLKMQENGIKSREIQRLYAKKPECHTSGGNFVSVGLIDLYPAFLLLILGCSCSFILFILEKIVHHK